jgi:serine/threonine protein kinase
MVLEWLDGTPLDALLAEDQRLGQPWTEGEVVGFLRRILPILDVAHRRGVTHRDIKPANIFVMGSAARAPDTPCKLLDFGVAKIVSEHAKVNAALAKTGVAITSFTPRYGAPEQFTRSHGATGPWTDVYSVALLACEMLTGRAALEGEDLVQFGFSSANPARRPTPRFLGARVSDQLEEVFAKALAVRPEDRFQHAGEFLEGVERGLPSPTQAAPSTSLQLAPTVLVRIEDRAMAPATTKPEPPSQKTTKPEPPPSRRAKSESPPPKEAESGVGSLIFILVLLVGAFVGYSMTDLRGTREMRAFFSPVVRLVRKEVSQQLPKLRQKTRQVMENAADILAEAAPACPPGTRLVTSVPAHAPEAHSDLGEHGPTERVCVDEHPVSEMDYNKCAVCEQPNSSRGKSKTRRHAEFCIDGKTPTTDPIRCATWKQADSYCATLAARLPSEEELHALPPTLTPAPMEWTSATAEADRENRGPFRCAHHQ